MGGLSRRATVIEELRAEGPVFVADAGNLFYKDRRLPPGDLPQRRIAAELQAAAYQLAGLDAFTPGPGDFAVGLEALLDLIDRYELPAVAANLRCGERRFDPGRVLRRGGLSVGFIGVVDPGEEGIEGCAVDPPVPAAVAAAEDLGPVDLTVLLVQGPGELDRQLAAAVPGADVVINGQTRRTNRAAQDLGGGVWQVGAGPRGKRLGIIRLSPGEDPGAGWVSGDAAAELERRLARYRERLDGAKRRLAEAGDGAERARAEDLVASYERKVSALGEELDRARAEAAPGRNHLEHRLVDLDDEVADHPATRALVEAALARMGAAEAAPEQGAGPRMGPYAGSRACAACHAAEYAQWQSTAHSRAWEQLRGAGRELDRDCFGCHVTGAQHPEGPQRPAEVPELLRGVGCESCHGPARAHAENPALEPGPGGAIGEETCTACHDGVRDEGRFDYAAYLPAVRH